VSHQEESEADLAARQTSFDFGPPRPSVRGPRQGERRSFLEVIGRAFLDDPVAIHLFPNEKQRSARFGRFAGLAMDSMGPAAHLLTTDTLRGAAIWQRPGPAAPRPTTRLHQLKQAIGFLAVARFSARRAIRFSELARHHHPKEPHYYLAILGTDPPHQGQGIGSALVQTVLDRCDHEGIPAYLESSNENNIAFYQGHGFEVQAELTLPGGPCIWPMLRPRP